MPRLIRVRMQSESNGPGTCVAWLAEWIDRAAGPQAVQTGVSVRRSARLNVRESTSDEPQGSVLCAEDNSVDYFLVEEVLARWPKVVVRRVSSVQAALAAVAVQRPSVLLLDMRLGDGCGLDVLRPIRRNAATADLPVVVLSADAMPHRMRAAFDAGADGYWTKPLDLGRFVRKMRELLVRDQSTATHGA